MTMLLRQYILEELNVDKVWDDQNGSADEFDVLYDTVKSRVSSRTTTDEDESSVDSVDTDHSDDSDTESDDSVSQESFVDYSHEAVESMIALEEVFTRDNLYTAARYAQSGLVGLKDIGFEYGPVLLSHVYKTILYALDKILIGIKKGNAAIRKFIKNRMESYTVFKKKIASAKETLNLLHDTDTGDIPKYTDDLVISQLKIGNNANFLDTLEYAIGFMESYFSGLDTRVRNHTVAVQRIINGVMSGGVTKPEQYMNEMLPAGNFMSGTVSGYKPDSDVVIPYRYKDTLPGDIVFMIYMPKGHLTDRSDVLDAYHNSKAFLGFSQRTIGLVRECDHLSIDDLKRYLDRLDHLCDVCLRSEKVMDHIATERNIIKKNLNSYLNYLNVANTKISIKDSLAEYVALKMEFLDRVYVAGSMAIHDYIVRVITASLSYTKSAITVYS